MVQIGNYNYSDYYSSGAYAPREGTLSYAEFDPEAYLAARPDVAQNPGFTGQWSVPASISLFTASMVGHLPVMKHYMLIIKVCTQVTL
jgi:hypothetical protein